jgi:ribosomal protein S18 acetylase RimI-like enzyme
MGKMPVQIRRATVYDSTAIARVQIESYRTAYAGIFPQDYLDHFTEAEQAQDWYGWMMTKPRDLIYVAQTEAGEIVGYALARPGVSEVPPYDSELLALHVRRPFQRQGIGGELLRKAAEKLEKQGCASLILWVLAKNPARSFYEKLGGELLCEREIEVGEGVTATEVAYGWPEINWIILT